MNPIEQSALTLAGDIQRLERQAEMNAVDADTVAKFQEFCGHRMCQQDRESFPQMIYRAFMELKSDRDRATHEMIEMVHLKIEIPGHSHSELAQIIWPWKPASDPPKERGTYWTVNATEKPKLNFLDEFPDDWSSDDKPDFWCPLFVPLTPAEIEAWRKICEE